MNDIVIWNKTYHVDFKIAKKLKNSIEKYNKDNIPFYISCPNAEKQLLFDIIGTENYTFIPDEEIFSPQLQLPGWVYQILVKTYAYEKLNSKNILIIDSDAYFIRDFYKKDFIAYDDIPYSIIHENKQTAEYNSFLLGRNVITSEYSKAQQAYRETFGGNSNRLYDYGPNPHLFSSAVLDSLKENYLIPNGFTWETFYYNMKKAYPDIHPRETLMYGEYLLAAKPIDIIPSGPLFKVYHWPEMVKFEKDTGLFNEEHIKDNYLGIVYQSKLDPSHPQSFVK